MRYFFVYYTWSGENKNGDGNLRFEFDGFPSNEGLKEVAKRNCPCTADVIISGWQEFASKEDYLAFEEPLEEDNK